MLVLPNKSITIWKTFWEENRSLVYKYVIKQIKSAIKEDKKYAVLFTFEGTNNKIWVEQKYYLDTLQQALDEFVKYEEFEYAARVKKIINELHVSNLIKETQQIRN
jgi:protein-arginine kinase activator protein McsA